VTGLTTWLIQRFSAVYLFFYTVFWAIILCNKSPIAYNDWLLFWDDNWIQGASMVAIFSIVLHAWIGIWTVCTDYLKCVALRWTVLASVLLLLVAEFYWAFTIIVV
jgi:succinate dehydrogenase / fumarate reductase, membrane anchor subunit